jgi:hypothetical protein
MVTTTAIRPSEREIWRGEPTLIDSCHLDPFVFMLTIHVIFFIRYTLSRRMTVYFGYGFSRCQILGHLQIVGGKM